jgi:Ca2+-binding EF-hand superfamily protein
MKTLRISMAVSVTLAALVCNGRAAGTNQMSEITLPALPLNARGHVTFSALRTAVTENFKRKDMKGDGKLTLDEFLASADIVFNEMDTKKKGFVDLDDMLRYRCGVSDLTWSNAPAKPLDHKRGFYPQMAGPGHAYVEPWEFIKAWTGIFHLTDVDHDGKITALEFKNSWKMWFDETDANHDGVITLAEFTTHELGAVKAPSKTKKPVVKKAAKPEPAQPAPASDASTNAPVAPATQP